MGPDDSLSTTDTEAPKAVIYRGKKPYERLKMSVEKKKNENSLIKIRE